MIGLQLGTSINGNDCAGYPAGVIRTEKSNHVRDVRRLADSLQRLHAERDASARFGLGEI